MSITTQSPQRRIETAIKDFAKGEPVLVYDFNDREGEVDMIVPADAVTANDVSTLRNDAGGLICVALDNEVCECFDLPLMADEVEHAASHDGPLSYGDRSSFSFPVNHKDTHTGITDGDRALTIRELANAANNPESIEFHAHFRIPGHVPILRGAPNLLHDRQGHTELGLALAELAGRSPAVVVCEMLDDTAPSALPKKNAGRYAKENGYSFLLGSDLYERFC